MAKRKKPAENPQPRIGSAYNNAKRAAALFSPVTDATISAAQSRQASYFMTELRPKANMAYVGNAAVLALDGVIDKKTGQSAALSRGSITAWAPEVFNGLQAFVTGQGGLRVVGDARSVHANLSTAYTGYDPQAGSVNWQDPRFTTYRLMKHGGQAIRILANRTSLGKRMFTPVKRVLGAIGGAV